MRIFSNTLSLKGSRPLVWQGSRSVGRNTTSWESKGHKAFWRLGRQRRQAFTFQGAVLSRESLSEPVGMGYTLPTWSGLEYKTNQGTSWVGSQGPLQWLVDLPFHLAPLGHGGIRRRGNSRPFPWRSPWFPEAQLSSVPLAVLIFS